MEQIEATLNQSPEAAVPLYGPPIRSTLSPGLSGFVLPIGVLPATPVREHLVPAVLFQSAFGQQVPEHLASMLIPGRVTGTVRLIQKVAHAWSLTNEELASLLAYPSPQLAGDLVSGKLSFAGNEDRADRARLMYFIHTTLSDLFLDQSDEARWIRTRNHLLKNDEPLNVMIALRIPGMIRVRELVEQHLANRR